MNKTWIARAGLALGAGLALAASIAAPAQAADVSAQLTDPGGRLIAEIIHHDDGDVFSVHDWYRDGHGVRGSLYLVEDGERVPLESVYNGLGSGEFTTFEWNILSGQQYVMEVCSVDGANDPEANDCVFEEITE
jgi:opacity protein-like surface antigen